MTGWPEPYPFVESPVRIRRALVAVRLLGMLAATVVVLAAEQAAEGAASAGAGKAEARASEPPPPPLAITAVEVRPRVPQALRRVDLAIRLAGGPFENPDDPARLDLRAAFRTPGGETVTVPGFRYRGFRPGPQGKRLVPEGEPSFRVRYTPLVAGMHTCTVVADAGDRHAEAEPVTLRVLAAEAGAEGFLRLHPDHPTYYRRGRSGRPVYLMGCVLDGHQFGDKGVEKAYGTRGLCDRREGITPAGLYATYEWYRSTVEQLADAGATCVRLPLHSWFLPLEAQNETTRVPGLAVGRYHAGNAWIADQVIRLCEERGLAVIPVTWNYRGRAVKEGRSYAASGRNRDLARRRLRYQVARWSYSPAVLGWTLFDEAGLRPTDSDYWREMIAYLRGLDPNGHFVFNTPYGVDQEEQVYPHPYAYPLAEFPEGADKPLVVTAYGTPEHVERLARAGLWASVAGRRAGALFAHAWHLREAGAFETVYRTTAAMLGGEDFGGCTWRKAYVETIAGPGGLHYDGMVGDRRRAFVYGFRTPARRDEPYDPADGNMVRIGDFEPGTYALQWWKPDGTAPAATDDLRCRDTTVLVPVPDGIRRHVMAKIIPADEGKGL